AAYYVAANHAVLDTEFAWTYSYFAGFAGWLIVSLVMRKSAFGKWIGGIGAVVSALFVVDMALTVTALARGVSSLAGHLILPLQLAFVIFFVAAGTRLYKIGAQGKQYA
ncbi:MAG TPA: hypothetical protein VEF91_05600, partial [Verrucomicrobiae bacterium]|nr:hypothetical protein [Verrucomicrobiae bacterium]